MGSKKIKDEMTQGFWQTSPRHIYSFYSIANLSDCGISENAANAAAIVSAVNNTWAKGIDPNKVPEMVESLQEIVNMYHNGLIDVVSFDKYERLLSEIKLNGK